jgi:hypothetical protein
MAINYLDSEMLYYSFVSGAREVIRNRKVLNDINVFPVADGDTGSNMASTMNSIIEEARVENSVRGTMSSIADAAISGARGNSGIIIAQYINGIFMSLRDDAKVSVSSFAQSVWDAVPHAYNAISEPVEGTIITVIRDWAEAVYRHKDHAEDFHELLSKPMVTASESLKATTGKLKVLEEARVVDSGAKGFVYFVEGLTEFIRTGLLKDDFRAEDLALSFDEYPEHDHGKPQFRFCTEAMISGEGIDLNEIKKSLHEHGDSLIVAGSDRRARIHIHTDKPEAVMQLLKDKGRIMQQKADDMIRQYEALHARKSNIAIVTDSIADLPQEFIDRHQIHVVPLNLEFEGTSYLDKVTMTPEVFYPLLDTAAEYPKSAQPGIKALEGHMALLSSVYDSIIVITVAKVQSGTYNSFVKAAEKLAGKGARIRVIDSRQNSGAEGLLVMKAAELIENGSSFEDTVAEVERLRLSTRILVSVNTLKYMVRSGRLSKAAGFAGKIVNLKPVVSLDEEGKGTIAGKAFSTRANTQAIREMMKEDNTTKGITRYAIVHANDEDRAEDYRRMCVDLLGKEPEYMMNISTIVGMSAGAGSVAVAYMCGEEA